jgi:hypothetical protein
MTDEIDVVGIGHRFAGERIFEDYAVVNYPSSGENNEASFPEVVPVGAQSIFHGRRWWRRSLARTVLLTQIAREALPSPPCNRSHA